MARTCATLSKSRASSSGYFSLSIRSRIGLSAGIGFGVGRGMILPSTWTPRSRLWRLRPIGARSRNFLSIYFCHRSQGSITCMSESIALNPFFMAFSWPSRLIIVCYYKRFSRSSGIDRMSAARDKSPPQVGQPPRPFDLVDVAVVIISADRRAAGELGIDQIELRRLLHDRLNRCRRHRGIFDEDIEGELVGLIQYFGVGLARVFRQDRFRVLLVDNDLFDSFHCRLAHTDDDFAIPYCVGFTRDQALN